MHINKWVTRDVWMVRYKQLIQMKYCAYVTNTTMLLFYIIVIAIDILAPPGHKCISILLEECSINNFGPNKMTFSDIPTSWALFYWRLTLKDQVLQLYHKVYTIILNQSFMCAMLSSVIDKHEHYTQSKFIYSSEHTISYP